MGSIYFPHVVKASRAPVATDDRSRGYVVGQVWIHENGDKHDFFICTNETENQAEWSNAIDKLADPDNPVWDMEDFIASVKKNMGLGTAAFVDTGEITGTIPVIGPNNKIVDKLINTNSIVSDGEASGNVVSGSNIGTNSKRYATMYADLIDALRATIGTLTVTGTANINGSTTIGGDLSVTGDIIGKEATFDKITIADGSNMEITTQPSKPIDLNYITTYQVLPNTRLGSSHTLGNSSSRFNSGYFNTLYATTVKALYYNSDNADIAERFFAKKNFEVGNIVSINETGVDEIRLATKEDKNILGVISENPAYELNSSLKKEESYPIAYFGRVNILIGGPVKKGQYIKMSLVNGVGKASDNYENSFAQALETDESMSPKLVMCVLNK